MKKCSKCGVIKEHRGFGRCATRADGLQCWCKECKREHYLANKRRILEKQREYNAAHREVRHQRRVEQWAAMTDAEKDADRERLRVWREANRDRHRAKNAAWRRDNIEKARESARKWNRLNRGKRCAAWAAYIAAKLQRTPAWADKKLIEEFYAYAALLQELFKEPFHVDHVIPLRGETVSGLHVENNLQILTACENTRKGNKYNEEET